MVEEEAERKKDKQQCLEVGAELNELMADITQDRAAPHIGVSQELGVDSIIAAVTEGAAEVYFHPRTKRKLGEILDEVQDCSDVLETRVLKHEGSYLVTLPLKGKK